MFLVSWLPRKLSFSWLPGKTQFSHLLAAKKTVRNGFHAASAVFSYQKIFSVFQKTSHEIENYIFLPSASFFPFKK